MHLLNHHHKDLKTKIEIFINMVDAYLSGKKYRVTFNGLKKLFSVTSHKLTMELLLLHTIPPCITIFGLYTENNASV